MNINNFMIQTLKEFKIKSKNNENLKTTFIWFWCYFELFDFYV